MDKYQYDDPVKQGHHKFELTKKQHNNLFKHRQIKWTDKYEYYYNKHHIILHKFDNWQVVLLNTILFPVLVLLHGVINYKQAWKELMELYSQKKSGSFVSDHVSSGSDKYNEIMDISNNKIEVKKEQNI